MRLRRTHATLVAIGLLLVGALPASAGVPAPTVGWLDPSFGANGSVLIPRSSPGTDRHALGIVAVGPGGRIDTLSLRGGVDGTVAARVELAAFTASGRPVASFNGGRSLDLLRWSPGASECCDLRLLRPMIDSGAEVVFGQWESYVYARRYSATGTRVWRQGDRPLAYSATSLSGGSIRYLWADIDELITHPSPLFLRGWTPDGAVDTRIGPGGMRALDILAPGGAIVADPGNRLYIAGPPIDADPDTVLVQRRGLHGALDATYGTGGSTSIAIDPTETLPSAVTAAAPPAIALGQDDALYLAGQRSNGAGGTEVVVRKLTPGGFVDEAFGDAGALVIPAPSGSSRLGAMLVDDAGHVIVSYVDRGSTLQPMLARFDSASGQLDPGFGNGGQLRVGNLVTSMALTADGDVLTVSRGVRNGTFVLYLARRTN